MVTFEQTKDKADIDTISTLAHEIWNQYFVSIIGQAQVDYMLEKFQSSSAIEQQMNDGYEYYIISNIHNNISNNVGYLGLLADTTLSRMMLSKIYIKDESRALGIGGSALNYVIQLSKVRQINTIWLTVNKYNKETIEWYLRKGFAIIEEAKKDIGNGFLYGRFYYGIENMTIKLDFGSLVLDAELFDSAIANRFKDNLPW